MNNALIVQYDVVWMEKRIFNLLFGFSLLCPFYGSMIYQVKHVVYVCRFLSEFDISFTYYLSTA